MWSYRVEAPHRLVAHDIEPPSERSLADGEVVLRFLAGGICGSDLPLFRGGGSLSDPEPFGRSLHEIVGEVVTTRCGVDVGERVVGWVDGNRGLNEFVVTTGDHLIPVADGLENCQAVVIQPLACVLYGLSRVRRIESTTAAIIGLGSIGMLFAHVLKRQGAAFVTGIDLVDRNPVGAVFGLDRVEHASSTAWADTVGPSAAPNVVIEAVGRQVATLNDGIRAVSDGGEILYFGLPGEERYAIDLATFKDKHLSLHAGNTPGSERRAFLSAAQRYLLEHESIFDTYLTHVLPATAAQDAYELASTPLPGRLKVVLKAVG